MLTYDLLLIYAASDVIGGNVRELSAYLKSNGITTKTIYLAKEYWETLDESELDAIAQEAGSARLVGLSFFSNHYKMAAAVTERLKKERNTPVIWGGVHATLRPKQSLKHADAVCVGEGELALTQLFAANPGNEPITFDADIQGIWKKKDGRIIDTGFGLYLENLDVIPRQELFAKDAYLPTPDGLQPIDPERIKNYFNGRISMFASRGCPFICTFCINNFLNSNSDAPPVRKKSVDTIIDEIIAYVKEWPEIRIVRFDDDAFISLPLSWMKRFCERYKKDVGLPLDVSGVNPVHLRDDKLGMLVDAGLTSIRMGIQTGSESARLAYKRKETNSILAEKFAILKKYDIEVRLDFILDNPFETQREQVESLHFINRIPVKSRLNFYSLTFYPGTELYDRAIAAGIIADEESYLSGTDTKFLATTYINALNFFLGLRKRSEALLSFLTSDFILNSSLAAPVRRFFVWKYPFMEPRYFTFKS